MPFEFLHTPLALWLSPLKRRRELGGRQGFTLIELLVVISIMLILTVIAIPALSPVREEQRLREAAKAVHAYFGSARALAQESGHPVGVMLQRQQIQNSQGQTIATVSRACTTLFQVEQPPCYTGDVMGATVMVRVSGVGADGQGNPVYDSNGNPVYFNIEFKPTDPEGSSIQTGISAGLLRVGDWIQFDHQGPRFQLTGHCDNSGVITFTPGTTIQATTRNTGQIVPNLPWPNVMANTDSSNLSVNPFSQPVSFAVYRQPMHSTAVPLALPPSVAIDLQFSGNDSYYAGSASNVLSEPISFAPGGQNDTLPVYIMFAPNGTVQEVYATSPYPNTFQQAITSNSTSFNLLHVYNPTEPLYLLIGDHARIKTNMDTTLLSATPAAGEFPNWYSKNSLWLTLAPQSGLMRIAENYPVDVANPRIVGGNFSWNTANGYGYSTTPSQTLGQPAINLSTSVWWQAILQSRSFARGTYFDASGNVASLLQGTDDMGGSR